LIACFIQLLNVIVAALPFTFVFAVADAFAFTNAERYGLSVAPDCAVEWQEF
jgi:hypothetical protein